MAKRPSAQRVATRRSTPSRESGITIGITTGVTGGTAIIGTTATTIGIISQRCLNRLPLRRPVLLLNEECQKKLKTQLTNEPGHMLRRFTVTLTCGLLGVGLSLMAQAAQSDGAPVKLADLPSAVQKTIQDHVGSAQLGEILRTVEDSETNYDVEFTAKGTTRDFTVGEDGELLSEQVFLAELAPNVQKGIQTQVGKGTLGDITKTVEDGEVTYDVEMTNAGRTRSFTVSPEGQLLALQVFLEETPTAVQQAVQKELKGGKCGEVYKSADGGEAEYDVEILVGGKSRSCAFDSHGALVYQEEPIALSDTPAPVQRAIHRLSNGGKLLSLSKAMEDGDVTYELDWVKDGKHQSGSLTPRGRVLPPESND